MKPNHILNRPQLFLPYFLSALFLLTPAILLAGNSAPFVTKIRVTGNTLVDPFDMEGYLDLGNGLNMTPEIMDLVVSELKANFNYHGYPLIGAYSTLKVRKGVMTIKVDEKDEYRWGKPRAERATLKRAFLHDMTLKESKKQKVIKTLVKGYQKQKLIEEIVAEFLVEKQRKLIEEIHYQRIVALREKVVDKVRAFQTIKRNMEEQEHLRVEGMKDRIESAGLKKFADQVEEVPEMTSEEYTDLDEFLDNVVFEEMLKPGL
ncbi:MAG: hypothetical protein HN472_09040 [Nitrospina sp.]|jgi:hypothetical protein|nr:hypothetical protein [Nitrospina sp.]MBT3875495.1 hypothetical protein [Nitrospina sp.]MBT4048849.1 hypothetical protein [Nitrospina sp.]MBT4556976.1 hypothetical protein [Nitrospina sp.]MBT5349627.1 hypothetical protein [Nitrospina sp.]